MDLNHTVSHQTPFEAYRPSNRWFDEFRGLDANPRDAWRPIANKLDQLGQDGIRSRASEADRLVRESGANFRLSSDQRSRPWQLAIVPLVLEAADWTKIEAGVQQRVRLLEAVLHDFLGPQRLLRDNVLPAALLSANPEFARTYHGLAPTQTHRLHLTAIDLARDSQGNWCVTGDRTRAPSGLGYALENRILTSRVLPSLIRQSNVTRFASFFSTVQEHLKSLAPRMRENPRVAILTPGKESYRYIEDAYLARYLGYTLVQGRDLAVRGDRLNLKTLGGLLPIEVLWRHVSDHKCDPIELDPNSTQGVTGLLRTIRSGSVAVANSVGSTLAQTPALMPFLGAACRYLFGEDLHLPSIRTFWCGQQSDLQYVQEHIDELLIRPAYVVSGAPPIVTAGMTSDQRESLLARIRATPHLFIAQERPERSTTPVWQDNQLHSWHVALRSFQVQSENGVHVLPGGLSRVSPDPHQLDQSPSSGRLGQDCWVVASEPVDQEATLLPSPHAELHLTRGGDELPSRVAENLFWLGRYAERTESIARLLRTSMVRIAGENSVAEMPDLPRLIAALAAMGHIEPDYAIKEFGDAMPTLEAVLPDSVFDREQPRGLQAGVVQMVDKATEVRDRISLDAYRIISRIGDDLTDPPTQARKDVGTMIDRVNRLITDLIALSGLASEGMTRSHGWRFLQLGRRIERAFQTSELLAATWVYPISDERPLLESVLRVTDSLMTYRSRYLLQLRPVAAIDLLVTDETNPRSILYQLRSINKIIGQLPGDSSNLSLGADQRIAEELLHELRMSDPNSLAHVTGDRRNDLDELLKGLLHRLPALSDAISARYLIHTSATQELTGRVGPDNPESLDSSVT
ncbi:MAG: circularly permuted type 2 ATP-grasp protein [Rubripirellula sp.]